MKAPNPENLKQVKDLSRSTITFAIAKVPGAQRAYVGGSDFKVCEVDFATDKVEPKELYSHQTYVTGVALAGTRLISGGYDGKLVWWDTEAAKTIRTTDAHDKWIRRVISSPGGDIIASIADDMACKIWDAASGKLVHDLRGHKLLTPQNFTSMLYAVAFSADGKLLATGDKVGHAIVWDVATGEELAACEAPIMYTFDQVQRLHSIGGIRSLAFSPDSKLLAVGGTGKIGNIDHLEAKARVEVFDWKSGKREVEFPGEKFSGLVNKLQFAPDGSWLLGAGGAGEGFLQFYDVAAKKTLRQEKLSMHVHDFALSENADTIYSVGHNRMMVHKIG